VLNPAGCDESGVNAGVDALRAASYRNSDISVLFPGNCGTKDFAHEKNTKAPEGSVAGGASGLAIGGALGWLAGIRALAIPGIGPFIAAGPIVGALADAGAGVAVGGLWAHWWAWEFRNTRRNATRAESAAEEF
jgi:hypothetical protein